MSRAEDGPPGRVALPSRGADRRPAGRTLTGAATAPCARDASWEDARAAARLLGERMRARLPRATASVPLDAALGRVLAHDLRARIDLPQVAVSAMDGWAVGSPGAGPWRVGAPVRAGDAPAPTPLGPGEARPISTGGPVPPAAAGILRSEHGEVVGGVLRRGALAPAAAVRDGADIRPAGEEASHGSVLLAAGTRLTPVRLGHAAAAGHDRVDVRDADAADLLHLGDEVEAHGLPAPGRVRDAIAPVLPGLLASHGVAVGSSVRVGDDLVATRRALSATTAPLVITTGSSARGAADHLRAALDGLHARLVVDGVRMRPGHPVMLAELPDGRVVLCLPGNPMAAVACLLSLLPPLAAGRDDAPLQPLPLHVAGADLPGAGSATRLLACALDAHGRLGPLGAQGPGMLRGLASADALGRAAGRRPRRRDGA
ncbi:molybdopterin molybdotransferase MoeA, partial [Clavibacter michiganensis]|uniref:molybdopterin molybdotransferase MoeA n=1 Tax=Clavibacter michiganensis TaxID=28447 RepID=UPI000A38DC03